MTGSSTLINSTVIDSTVDSPIIDSLAATQLRTTSSPEWLAAVVCDFDEFLQDHAANERKASTMAMSMVVHYPDKPELVDAMVDLALEELNHFRQVIRLMKARGVMQAADAKDPYVNLILKHVRKGTEHYFLDRLLSAAVIEARGAERFALIAGAESLAANTRTFYKTLARSEANHHQLFIRLACEYFPATTVESRLNEWLDIEAESLAAITIAPRLH
ncbi:MAG: tRNA-(ms[2]io[6]A)-hydroxylase [Candidatus Azotimanducaceae bacterium]|jgi:tRNA-(ms[2]io[6]A)-hydroxylase